MSTMLCSSGLLQAGWLVTREVGGPKDFSWSYTTQGDLEDDDWEGWEHLVLRAFHR